MTKWRENFKREAKSVEIEYNSFFLNRKLEDLYTIDVDESQEWELKLNDELPDELKTRLQKIFLAAKPEDSI